MSFDTSNNSGTWVSNYGASGQILSSQGSSAPPKWITNSGGGGGGIVVQNPYITGIPYVVDLSGNLDSNIGLTYDGSGLSVIVGDQASPSALILRQTKNIARCIAELRSNGLFQNEKAYLIHNTVDYGNSTNLIDQGYNTLTLKSTHGRISLIPDSSNTTPSTYQKILLGYQSGAKAIEINSFGAMSFDTSGNNDSAPMTFTSNYGTSGQVLMSQGSSAPPQWTTPSFSGFPKIISIVNSNYSITYVDSSANLYSANLTGLTSGKTRIITFTTQVHTSTIGTGYYEYTISITGTASQIYNVKKPITNLAQQHTITFTYSNTNTIETIVIKLNTIDGTLNIGTNDYYSFRMEEIQ
jgi:hypothetical protein